LRSAAEKFFLKIFVVAVDSEMFLIGRQKRNVSSLSEIDNARVTGLDNFSPWTIVHFGSFWKIR
jgi:hypothetical protein